MELSDQEIGFLDGLLDDAFDKMHHHPDDFEDWEHEAYGALRAKLREEAKRRGFWWAK